jgi:hypothetical protein
MFDRVAADRSSSRSARQEDCNDENQSYFSIRRTKFGRNGETRKIRHLTRTPRIMRWRRRDTLVRLRLIAEPRKAATMMAKMRVIRPSRHIESEMMMISRREQEHYIRLHAVYLRCRRKVHCVRPRFLSRLPILRWKHTMYCFRLPQLPYLLERFCSRLQNDGMEVLNLNRDGKWQPRFLKVSSEVAFPATGGRRRTRWPCTVSQMPVMGEEMSRQKQGS